jgi:hypothetical protein
MRDVFHTLGRRSQEDKMTFQVLDIIFAFVFMSFDGSASTCDNSSSEAPNMANPVNGMIVDDLWPMYRWRNGL